MILDSDYDAAIRREQLAQARATTAERERDEARAQLATVKQALMTTLIAMRECAKHVQMIHIAELDIAENAEIEALAALGMVRVSDEVEP